MSSGELCYARPDANAPIRPGYGVFVVTPVISRAEDDVRLEPHLLKLVGYLVDRTPA